MQLVFRVTVLAICVLGALSFPNFGQDISFEPSLESFQVQLLASKIDTRKMSAAETYCADTFNNRTQKINNNLIAQTNNCFINANTTLANNNRTNNNTINTIRNDIKVVQFKLSNCTFLQDNTAFLNCITQSFDNNMLILDSANSRAYQVMAQMAADLTQVEVIRQGCTSAVVGHAKTELVQSSTEYNMCLDRIRQQRMIQSEMNPYGLN